MIWNYFQWTYGEKSQKITTVSPNDQKPNNLHYIYPGLDCNFLELFVNDFMGPPISNKMLQTGSLYFK